MLQTYLSLQIVDYFQIKKKFNFYSKTWAVFDNTPLALYQIEQ